MTSAEGTQVVVALIASIPATLAVVMSAFLQRRQTRVVALAVAQKVDQVAVQTQVTALAVAEKVDQVAVLAAAERALAKAATLEVAHKVEYVAAQTAAVAEKIDTVVDQSATVAQTVAVVVAKTDEAHDMVNSRLSEALCEIERLRTLVENFREGDRQRGEKVEPMKPSILGQRKKP